MLKRALLLLLSFQLVACSMAMPARDVQSEGASADKSLAKQFASQCSNLLYPPSKQFDFGQFCNARAKYQDQIITEAHFANWRKMPVEELMALIELHTLQTNASTKGLEFEQLNARKRMKLKSEIERLQKTEKNVFTRIRKLMSFWYETTHSENLKLSFKRNPLTVPQFFKKIRAEDRLARLEGELSARSAIAVFAESGLVDNPTWWGSGKKFLSEHSNVVQSVAVVAMMLVPLAVNIVEHSGFTVGAVTSVVPLIALPMLKFDTAKKLADEYENVAAEKGHVEARELVLNQNMKRNVHEAYYRTFARYANMVFFAAALSWGAYNGYIEKKEFNEAAQAKIYAAMRAPQDNRSTDVKLKEYGNEVVEQMIRDMETQGIHLSEQDKAKLRENAATAASEVAAQKTSSSQ